MYFLEPANKIAFEKFVKKIMGLPADDAAVSNALKLVATFCDVAERLLQRRDYMAGDSFSLVDIYYIPLVQRLIVCGVGDVILSRTAMHAWWTRCINRPAVQQTLFADRAANKAATDS